MTWANLNIGQEEPILTYSVHQKNLDNISLLEILLVQKKIETIWVLDLSQDWTCR